MPTLTIRPGKLTLGELRAIYQEPQQISVASEAQQQIRASAELISRQLKKNKPVYGINTGFGLLANTRIDTEHQHQLQHNLILSHACGIGTPIREPIVRLIMVLKINSLARGFSGVRPVLIERLIQLVNHEIYPRIPEKGSVGASGDLAPLPIWRYYCWARGRQLTRTNRLAVPRSLPCLS